MLYAGIVGIGFAAQRRAEALQDLKDRVQLVGVYGRDSVASQTFAHRYGIKSFNRLEDLLSRTPLDLVIIANRNVDHGAVAQQALEAGKHVVVEYPLALDWQEGEQLRQMATARKCLLHVEHIELLGGWHLALKEQLPAIGSPHFVRYVTLQAQNPAPERWTYSLQDFGFPFVGALSRIHRLTDVLGRVSSVSANAQFMQDPAAEGSLNFFKGCVCTAQLRFKDNALATVIYGKGENIWRSERLMEVQGSLGTFRLDQDQGTLFNPQGETPVEVGGRRGLFARDTAAVLDYLQENIPLYVSLEASLYALKVANALQRSVSTGQAIALEDE